MDRIKSLKSAIDKYLDSDLFRYEIVYTEHPQHGVELAKNGAEKGFDLIVAVGGDGSVNDVINGIYGSKAALGIIPKGSGNGLARSLKIPLNEARAIQLFNQWHLHNIDIGQADSHLFASNAGVGFDTIVTEQFSKSKRRGFTSYLAIILKGLWRYSIYEWDLEIDGQKTKSKSFMITAANASQLGYGFKIAPHADLEDGYFDLICIRKFPKLLAGLIALRAFSGKILGSPYVTTRRSREIIISHPELKIVQFDGEAHSCGSRIVIKMMPQKMAVIAN